MATVQYSKTQTPKLATTIQQNVTNNELTKLYGTNNTGVNKLTSVYGTNRSNELSNIKNVSTTNTDNNAVDNNIVTPEVSASNTTTSSNNDYKNYLNTTTNTSPVMVNQQSAYETFLKELSGGKNYDASKKWNEQAFLKAEDWDWKDIIKAENAYKALATENILAKKTNSALESAATNKENALRDAYINNEFAKKNLQSNLQSRGLGTSGVASSFDNELFNMYLNNTNSANANYKSNVKSIKDSYDDSMLKVSNALENANSNGIKDYQTKAYYDFIEELNNLNTQFNEGSKEYNDEYKNLLESYKDKLDTLDYKKYNEKLGEYKANESQVINLGKSKAGKYDVTIQDAAGNSYGMSFGQFVYDDDVMKACADLPQNSIFIYNNKIYKKQTQKQARELEESNSWFFDNSGYERLKKKYNLN